MLQYQKSLSRGIYLSR